MIRRKETFCIDRWWCPLCPDHRSHTRHTFQLLFSNDKRTVCELAQRCCWFLTRSFMRTILLWRELLFTIIRMFIWMSLKNIEWIWKSNNRIKIRKDHSHLSRVHRQNCVCIYYLFRYFLHDNLVFLAGARSDHNQVVYLRVDINVFPPVRSLY